MKKLAKFTALTMTAGMLLAACGDTNDVDDDLPETEEPMDEDLDEGMDEDMDNGLDFDEDEDDELGDDGLESETEDDLDDEDE